MKRFSIWCAIALASLFIGEQLHAQTGTALLRPWEDSRVIEQNVNAQIQGYTETDVDDQDFQVIVYQFSGRVRFNNERAQGNPAVGYELYYLAMDGDNSRLNDLSPFDLSVGFATPIPLGIDDWKLGVSVGVGYAGTHAMTDSDAIYGMVDLVASYKINDKWSMTLGLNYDGSRTVLPEVPLPGVTFSYIADDTQVDGKNKLKFYFGIPFSGIEWRPFEKFELNVYYTLPLNFKIYAGYEFLEDWTAFAQLHSETRAFNEDNVDGNNRIFFSQRTVEIGIGWDMMEAVSWKISIGYAFDQSFSEGWNSWNDEEISDVEAAPFVRIQAQIRF